MSDTKIELMIKSADTMLYLVTCGIHRITPNPQALEDLDIENLYKISRFHFLEALVGTVLEQAQVILPKEWEESISKAVRKNILFDAERAKILNFMEQKGIWHLPLKGIILKDYYPALGMRQMSDNDILFDSAFADLMREYMTGQGYRAVKVGEGNHDEYEKAPVYNFELHRSLYNSQESNRTFEKYYKNVKERLLPDEGLQYGYHFSDEDFYVYILTHEYKHYAGGGTGLRSLLDVYLYLSAKEESMDFAYIRRECEKLGIAEFEEQGRTLCRKVFSKSAAKGPEVVWTLLSEKEGEMLQYYLTSGVYGTTARQMENRIHKFQKETGSKSRLRYMWRRIFPGMEKYRDYYPFFYRHKWLLPIGWLYRAVRVFFVGGRRKRLQAEMKAMKDKFRL